MTAFKKENFNYDGLFLMYDGAFIARFKRGGMSQFKSFLTKNFSVEEYFMLSKELAPIVILETKGYLTPTWKTVLANAGYPVNLEGKKAYLTKTFPMGAI